MARFNSQRFHSHRSSSSIKYKLFGTGKPATTQATILYRTISIMASRAASVSSASKKRKNQVSLKDSYTKRNSAFILDSLMKTHVGKRILLAANVLYPPNPVPLDETHTLFQYSVVSINPNCQTAVIDFDNCCIEKDGDSFQNYPNTSGEITTLDNYDLNQLKSDNDLFNQHLGKVNKKINDLKEKRAHEEYKAKNTLSDSVSDIVKKFNEGSRVYDILLGEFEKEGSELVAYTMKGVTHTGKVNYKQDWSESCFVQSFIYH